MILVDIKGHLVSTDNEKELHEFASLIGLKREWYQKGMHPHYDLTTKNMIYRALRKGAKISSSKDLLRNAWWNK